MSKFISSPALAFIGIVLSSAMAVGQGFTINTFAGNSTVGYTGDGGPAIAAQLNLPQCVAVDAAGNVYIADWFNNVIREVTVNGNITTIAGNGTQGYSGDGAAATSAQLSFPNGLAIDSAGNLYIADTGNDVIREVTPLGFIKTIAGNNTVGYSGDGAGATDAQLYGPYGLALAICTFQTPTTT
jgi:sugar lactone lactonase YvrE